LLGYSALSDQIRDTPPSVTEVDQDVDANKIVFSRTAYEGSASSDYTYEVIENGALDSRAVRFRRKYGNFHLHPLNNVMCVIH